MPQLNSLSLHNSPILMVHVTDILDFMHYPAAITNILKIISAEKMGYLPSTGCVDEQSDERGRGRTQAVQS